jgi:hypothetical protein
LSLLPLVGLSFEDIAQNLNWMFLEHVSGTTGEHWAFDVDIQSLVDGRVRNLVKDSQQVNSSVVDRHINPAPGFDVSSHKRVELIDIADIGFHRERQTIDLEDFLRRGLRRPEV